MSSGRRQQPKLPPKKKKKAKRLEVEAAAIARGTELGKIQAHKRKPLLESVREHIGKVIDNFHIDPIEWAAISGVTYLVHSTVLGAGPLLEKANHVVTDHPATLIGTFLAGPLGYVIGSIFDRSPDPAAPKTYGSLEAGSLFQFWTPSAGGAKTGPAKAFGDNVESWILSFAIAFIIVRHGGQLLGLLGDSFTSLSKVIGFLLSV